MATNRGELSKLANLSSTTKKRKISFSDDTKDAETVKIRREVGAAGGSGNVHSPIATISGFKC